jgi:methyltransferase (TIGR00027 family)
MIRDNDVSAREKYVEKVIETGSTIALPELRTPSPDAIYHIRDRGGLGTVAIPEPALDERQLDALSRFRFAQYAAAGYADAEVVFRERLDQSPQAGYSSPDTVHFVVFVVATGELVASMCMLGPPPAPPGMKVARRDRPLFPVEEHFGRGLFDRLERVPQTPVDRVREYGRLAKNMGRHQSAGSRAVIELILAPMRLGIGEWANAFDVVIGHLDPSRVQRNLEFFHIPLVVLRSGFPYAPGHPLNPGLEITDRHPFAFAVADLASTESRLDAIEAALELPDSQAIHAFAALKQIPLETRSSLLPRGGLPALTDTPLPQRSLSNGERRRARELGEKLEMFRPFAGLSDPERTTLSTLAIETEVEPGASVARRGEVARELVLIEDGQAVVRCGGRAAVLIGPGACLGAGGVVSDLPAQADVVATTPLRTLRLPGDVYRAFLHELPDVDRELRRLARYESRGTGRSLIASNTAETQAALRAAGAALRDPVLRNPDSMAAKFLPAKARLVTLAKMPGVRRLLPAIAERLAPGSYGYELVRVKHVDAILEAELRDGLDQIAILGAGYDSRSYRFADALQGVRVFEVDLPAMSAIKRDKVARLLLTTPEHVTYVGADFRDADLCERLGQHGYEMRARTLLILSGVLSYLNEAEVGRLFGWIGRHSNPRSSIVFDYIFSAMVKGDDASHGAMQLRKRLSELGEPLRFGIPTGEVARFLEAFGLALVSDLQADELAERYLRREDGTLAGRPYDFTALAHARVVTPTREWSSGQDSLSAGA